MALVTETRGQGYFCYCFDFVDEALCLADAILYLELMRRKPDLCLKTSDKVVFADESVLCHLIDSKFAFWV